MAWGEKSSTSLCIRMSHLYNMNQLSSWSMSLHTFWWNWQGPEQANLMDSRRSHTCGSHLKILPNIGSCRRQISDTYSSSTSIPMTVAYAFMDYQSQGQTIPYVLVDIAQPPTGSPSPSNPYVAPPRSSGWDTIWLLWDFNEWAFQKSHETQLLDEDNRLEKLDRNTREWWARMREPRGGNENGM